ncbi:hypothetical protein BS17DRAFT_770426 [Gyrodon lividus]|nr:hypothetical protein BS17DRAFT_770426 [Gyrodon lividus]
MARLGQKNGSQTLIVGDNSKALMKVYLPAIECHVPDDMNVITDNTLIKLKDALQWFHQYREVFRDLGVRPDGFSLPHQHLLTHYKVLIHLFGAPNGLCTSITEFKHITAVKKPWQWSNKYNALGQILQMNQHLSQLELTSKCGACFSHHTVHILLSDAPQFPGCRPGTTARNTASNSEAAEEENEEEVDLEEDENAGIVDEWLRLAHSNVVLAHCLATRVALVTFRCALVHWFNHIIDVPDKLTGMWMVAPSFLDNSAHNLAIVRVNSII